MSEVPYLTCTYSLLAAHDIEASRFAAPELQTWKPDLAVSLEEALPAPWDLTYTETYRQKFQPVMFWRNANIIAHFVEQTSDAEERQRALEVLRQLIDRMREFTIYHEGSAWIENQFDFYQPGLQIENPWYSGIANAFAILGLRRCLDALAEDDESEKSALKLDIRQLANAYRIPYFEGKGGPDRWISYVTEDGHLWFEEYPMSDGQANLVLNGHIFALHALNEARAIWPSDGFATLICSGALSVAENYQQFVRRGKSTLYSLRGTRKGDYLPLRTVRQQYELFLLTGDNRFLSNAIRTSADIAQAVDGLELQRVVYESTSVIDKRLRFDERVRRRRYQAGEDPGPLQPPVVPPAQPPARRSLMGGILTRPLRRSTND